MRQLLIFCCLLLLASASSRAQGWDTMFVQTAQTTYTGMYDIIADGQGHFYVAGKASELHTACMDTVFSSSRGFISRIDTLGNCEWVTIMGMGGTSRPHKIALDEVGNVYVAGVLGSSASIHGYGSGFSVHNVSGSNYPDIWIAKFDTSGTPQ